MDIIAFNEASTANGRIESFIENPDSSSGIVTVPKVIASGETITIPAGRVAILPNVQVDGVINIEGEVFVPSGATLGDLDAQLALKADTSYVNTQLGFKANTADLKEIGVGQTWQDVTRSRSAGVTYTNNTQKPIMVIVTRGVARGFTAYFTVNGIDLIWSHAGTSIGIADAFSIIIPVGATYKCDTFSTWAELR